MLRIANDLQTIEVAEALNISRQYVYMCEREQRTLSAKKTIQFLDMIGVSEEEARAFSAVIKNN
ncbi:helix-turn-helix domain-containing protein [Cytobacillus firmus]|uniref:helix-turn-helix domain-containing protein n=1 Tax=Cytobacillus firmus TaxID=1399 RepID=UPI0036B27A47